MEPRTLTRSIQLDTDASAVWDLVSTAAGLSTWLADSVDVDVVPGRAGSVVDDGIARRLVVTEVDAGRRVGFVWWSEDDPEEASSVTIAVEDDGDGGARLTVVETLDPAVAGLAGGRAVDFADAAVDDLAATDAAWTDRLARLLGVGTPLAVDRA